MELGELVVSDRLTITEDGIFATDTTGAETFSLFANTGNAAFEGDITGASGTIGGVRLDNDGLSATEFSINSDGSATFEGDISGASGTIGGVRLDSNGLSANDFSIDSDGNATFEGDISGASGTIGGVTLDNDGLSLGSSDGNHMS